MDRYKLPLGFRLFSASPRLNIINFLDLIIVLEADSRMANAKRIPELFSFVGRLKSHQQCQVVMHLQKNHPNLKNVNTCWDFYQQYRRTLATGKFDNTCQTRAIVIELIQCYSQMGDEELLTSLVDNMFQDPPAATDLRLAETIILCPWIWEQQVIVNRIGLLYSYARMSFFSIFDSRCDSVKSYSRIEEINQIMNFHEELTPSVTKTMKLLTDCLRLGICLDRHPFRHVFHSGKLDRFSSDILSKLSVDVLCQLISGFSVLFKLLPRSLPPLLFSSRLRYIFVAY